MRIIFIVLLLCANLLSFAQTTIFTENRVINDGDKAVRLYSLENFEDHVIVTIQITALKKCKRIDYWTSQNTWLKSGDILLCLIRGYYINGRIEECGYNHQWGWTNVAEGETMYYQLYFGGSLPPGLSYISIDDGGCREFVYSINNYASVHSYCFNNYKVNLPRKNYSSIDSEYSAKKNIDANNDGICGIYEQVGGEDNYKLACIKENGSYKLIHLSSTRLPWWHPGDIKANLNLSTSGVFKAEWFLGQKQIERDTYVTFDGVSMTANVHGTKTEYLKMYPTNSPKTNGNTSDNYNKEWTGTGFALNDGYIITNNHVVDGAKSIVILGVNGNNEEYKAEVVSVDRNNDLALVKINDSRFSGFNSVPYAVSNRMCEVGEDVFVLGYPLTSYMGDEIKLTNGIVSSRSGYQGDVSTYQISAPVQPGNSGGPMFDSKGNVVGIVNAGIPGAENVGYAIKTSYLYNLVGSAVSTSIIPQTNRVTGTTLADKVRSVKKCVFYIKCKG